MTRRNHHKDMRDQGRNNPGNYLNYIHRLTARN